MAEMIDALEIGISVDTGNSTTQINDFTDALSRLQEVAKSIGKIDTSGFEKTGKNIRNSTKEFEKAIGEISAAGEKTKGIDIGTDTENGIGGATNALKGYKNALEQAGNAGEAAGNKVNSAFLGFGDTLKRVSKRLIAYKLIYAVINAIKDGLKNLYSASADGGGSFAKAMDSLATSFQYLKNSLGAMVAPLIEGLAPALTAVMDIISRLAQTIGKLFSALTGAKGFTKATKQAVEFGDAAKKAKDATLGIDELNIISQEDESAASAFLNEGNVSEESEMSKTLAGIFQPISDLFDGIMGMIEELLPVFKVFFDSFWDIFGVIVEVVNALLPAVTEIAKALSPVVALIAEVLVALLPILVPAAKLVGIICRNIIERILPPVQIALEAVKAIINVFKALFLLITGKTEEAKELLKNTVLSLLKTTLKGLAKMMLAPVNMLVRILNLIPGVNIPEPTAYLEGLIDKISFATGGFPEDGLFFANHGELVGQFANGKTAVANNEQIVDGIKQGVFEAVSSAMAGQQSGGEIRIFLDGKELAKSNAKIVRNAGASIAQSGVYYGALAGVKG